MVTLTLCDDLLVLMQRVLMQSSCLGLLVSVRLNGPFGRVFWSVLFSAPPEELLVYLLRTAIMALPLSWR